MPNPKRTWFEINPIPPEPEKPADKDRIDGMKLFVDWLKNQATPTERARCILDPCYAKQKFAEKGEFYVEGDGPELVNLKPIPASTVFRIYESEDPPHFPQKHRKRRDEQVILVLDNKEMLDHTPIWRCTYSPYTDHGIE